MCTKNKVDTIKNVSKECRSPEMQLRRPYIVSHRQSGSAFLAHFTRTLSTTGFQ